MKKLSAMRITLATMAIAVGLTSCVEQSLTVKSSPNDLTYQTLATSWDEALPLGNAFVGALVWQRDSATLRMSLDRIDLWDLRPIDSLSGDNFTFEWVYQQWLNNNYGAVQRKLDAPYDQMPAPSKIPGAALEFNIASLGAVKRTNLYLNNAVAEVDWHNGAKLQTFVSATEPVGWFSFEGVSAEQLPELIAPRYQLDGDLAASNPVSGHDLRRLGYTQGLVDHQKNSDGGTITYHQKGFGDFFYDVVVDYRIQGDRLVGVWSITSSMTDQLAPQLAAAAIERGMSTDYKNHMAWWDNFWDKSSISLPDSVLQKQYYNEMYKLGSLTRNNSPIIPLQGVWTADNGLLPPWKGDVHHDLNTQLSYWPCYIGNHLDEGFGYLQTLWNQRETNKKYTKQYFQCEGLAVPGVATITGEPMGGWIQYAMSPTISSWLAQHFYRHWKYSADPEFLATMGYPYVKDVATLIENVTIINADGQRTLRISSSPEIYNNSREAWFPTITNYDLAMLNMVFKAASEMAAALSLSDESAHWADLKAQLPHYDLDSTGALTFAKGAPYNESHRHFSNAIAVHPFSLLDVTNGGQEADIVRATIDRLDQYGSGEWTGYSFGWLGNMKARALDGEGAASALRDFAECFCLINTFHANGQQNGTGKSNFRYRPFTLEGNMAFASGVQEMLLQSHTDVTRVFPAIPTSWNDVSFSDLRAQGAFLISASKVQGAVKEVVIKPTMGGTLTLANPFAEGVEPIVTGGVSSSLSDGVWTIVTKKGETVTMKTSAK